MKKPDPSLAACCAAEAVGTFILVFLGCGAIHTAVTTGEFGGIGQVAIVWGLAVTLAVFAVGNVSGAHINPAITLALTVWQGFPPRRLLPYWLAQFAGAAFAAFLLYCIFSDSIAAYEERHAITRGSVGSEVTAAMYGEYFPNPTVGTPASLSTLAAMLAEILGTGLLAFMVLALTDSRNHGKAGANLAPVFIGATVIVLVAVFGPITQACLNPARDFGPRTVAYFAGWKEIAFPGPNGSGPTLAVYLVSPLLGAVAGGFLYAKLIHPVQRAE